MANTILQSKSKTTNRNKFSIFRMLSIFCLVMGFGVSGVRGQVTIASQDFESTPATPTMTISTSDIGTPGSSTGFSSSTSASNDAPASVNLFTGGSRGYRLQGPSSGSANTGRILTFSSVNTTSYSSVQASFRVAGMSLGSSGNGVDNSTGTTILGSSTPIDFALIEVSPDGGTTWYQQGVVSATGGTNVRWSFGATGTGSKAYAANNTYSSFNTTGTGTITSGTTAITTATITSLPSVSNLQIRITLQCNSANESWIIDDVIITGTATATPSIAISNGTIAAGSPNNGQTNVVLQRYDMAVTSANATLTGLTVTTAGTYVAADLTNLKCWHQSSSTFNSGTATLLSTKTTSLSPGSQVFPTFTSQAITSGNTGYIFVTADIASGATNGNTINIGTTAFSNITFSSGTKTGTDPVAAGGVQTITVAVPDIALSSPAASSANITVGTTNNVIYRFDLAISTATPSLTGVTINTSTGNNVSGDLTNLKCWYQTSTTFNSGTATLLSTKTTSLAAGSQVFPSFSSQSLTTGSTYYIFITADVPLTATLSNTIIVSAITTADLTFSSGNKTGSANASGTKTIIDCTPADVTSAAASSANLNSVLTWVNPTCYDEILIVAALASNSGTPSGDGSAYTSNLAYGSGTALGNGFVVYKGSTSSQTVTGLTNGTQYFYKFFTRRGTTWTSGTEVNATPNIAGYYWNGASIVANPAAGGTGTWGTANSWRQPSATGSQANWADNNNAIFAGTAGTVTLDATRVGTAFYINTNGYIFANSSTQTLTGPIILANNVGLTFSPNVNIAVPAGGTLNIGNVSGSGTANITINSAQGSATNIAQRINLAAASSSISVPINIVSAGGTGTGTVAGIVATSTGTSLTSAATITNNTDIKTIVGATSGNDITANGVISGSADLMFAAGASGGAGTVTLGAANTYTGATIFNAANSGVVRLGIANALPTSTNVTFGNSSGNGGSLDLNGFNQTLASIINGGFGSSANRIVNNGNTDVTLTINGSTSPTAFVFGIQDGTTNKIALVKAGSGTLILDGSTTTGGNTYTGLTTVSGGTLRLNRTGGTTIPIGNSVTVSGGTLRISSNQTLAGLSVTSGTVQIDAGVTLTIAGDVSIPSGANLILNGVLTSTGTRTLTIASGANITIGNASGLATATGTFSGGKTFTDGANYSVSVTTITPLGTDISANNFSTTESITLNSALSVTGTLSFGNVNSKTLTTSGNLTLKSSASGTGNIADLTNGGVNTGNSISGNVTVETFIPGGKRAYRLLGHPFSGTIALSTLIDNIHITGANGGGFDATGTNNPSAFSFNEATFNGTTNSGWSAFTNTANTIGAGQGTRILVRGPRSQSNLLDGTNPTPQAATLDYTGALNQGNVNVAMGYTGANGGNAGWNLIANPYASKVDIGSIASGNRNGITAFSVWLPNGGTRGAYVTTSFGSAYIIPAGSAFFVQTGSAANFTFTEANKSSSAVSGTLLKTDPFKLNALQLNVVSDDTLFWDQFVLRNREDALETKDIMDANKMENPDVNFYSTTNNNDKFAIDHRPLTTNSVVNLGFTTTSDYHFTFKVANLDMPGYDVYLMDKFLNKQTLLSSSTAYNFTTTSDANSKGSNRFQLVFAKNANGVNEMNTSNFIVYPNPASSEINISLSNANKGIYQFGLYNQLGQEIKAGSFNFNTNISQSLNIEELGMGVYFIKITNGNQSQTIKFIK